MTGHKVREYAYRNFRELDKLGGYYFKHVSAMTAEGLHSKSDIAAELGYRDYVIDTQKSSLTAKDAEIERLTPIVIEIEEKIRQQAAEIERLNTLISTLLQQAEIHAMEARTANATIAEVYQAVSGATGEPGNWNGAKPVVEKIEQLQDEINKLNRHIIQQDSDMKHIKAAQNTINVDGLIVGEHMVRSYREQIAQLQDERDGYVHRIDELTEKSKQLQARVNAVKNLDPYYMDRDEGSVEFCFFCCNSRKKGHTTDCLWQAINHPGGEG